MRVLLVVHGMPPACAGGTETYTLNLARALAAHPDVEVAVISREADPARPELGIRFDRRSNVDVWFVNNTFQSCAGFEDTYRNPALCEAVLPLVEAFDPDVVHIQHLTGLSTDLPGALTRRGLPVVMTLNDYWPICHRGQLLNAHGGRCDGPGTAGCAECIPVEFLAPPSVWRATRRLSGHSILRQATAGARRLAPAKRTTGLSAVRAHHMREMLNHASVLLAPSDTLRDRYRAFGVEDARLVRHDQGVPPVASAPMTPRQASAPLRVLFAGSLMQSKGPALLLEALERLPAGAVHVEFVGTVVPYHGDGGYASELVRRLGGAGIRRYGPAPHERVAAAVSDADVVVVPSIWIENAPFVIKEAFACGVPVIASRLGGMAELVRDGGNGLLFTPGDAQSLAETLRRIIDDPDLLPRLQRGIEPPPTIDAEAERLVALYREQTGSRKTSIPGIRTPAARADPRTLRVAAVVLNYGTPDETFLAARSIQTSRYPADIVVVDNGSRDDAVLRAMLPDADVISNPRNLGFSGGCNVGIARALERGADAVLLLNSDAVLQAGALGLLVEALRLHPSAGIAAPVLCAANEPALMSSAGISYDLSTGRMRHRGYGRRRNVLGTSPVVHVDAASGCALLVRREVFERCGMLDEAYFFSFEDVEFCLRARAAGLATLSVSAATVLHKGGATIGATSARRVYYGVRNHLRLAQQASPRSVLPRLARTAAILGYNAAYVMSSPDVPLLDGAVALTRGSIDHFRRRYGARDGA